MNLVSTVLDTSEDIRATSERSWRENITRRGATTSEVDIRVLRVPSGVRGDASASEVLRAIRIPSAGAVIMVCGYTPYLPPRVSTSPLVRAMREKNRTLWGQEAALRVAKDHELLAQSIDEQLKFLLAALSINKSQLADVLGVSRPTLYEWLDGAEPNPSNEQRIAVLVRLLASVGVTDAEPLSARLVRQPLGADEDSSLLVALAAKDLDVPRIKTLVQLARTLEEKYSQRRQEREERLRALGFEEPSDKQRNENMMFNVAARDWPKP